MALTIRLATDKSIAAMAELREKTAAPDDAQVIRDALRLYLTLVRAHEKGCMTFVRRDGQPDVPVLALEDDPGDLSEGTALQ